MRQRLPFGSRLANDQESTSWSFDTSFKILRHAPGVHALVGRVSSSTIHSHLKRLWSAGLATESHAPMRWRPRLQMHKQTESSSQSTREQGASQLTRRPEVVSTDLRAYIRKPLWIEMSLVFFLDEGEGA